MTRRSFLRFLGIAPIAAPFAAKAASVGDLYGGTFPIPFVAGHSDKIWFPAGRVVTVRRTDGENISFTVGYST